MTSSQPSLSHLPPRCHPPRESGSARYKKPRSFAVNLKGNPISSLLIIASVVITLVLTVCYLLISTRIWRNYGTKRYGIVIDSGSMGHRIHVFGYVVDGGNGAVFDFENDGLVSMGVNPRLSAYAEDPKSAGVLLQELVEWEGEDSEGALGRDVD
ncbi:hypothetical protein ACFXTH_012790 [Malus domestica]